MYRNIYSLQLDGKLCKLCTGEFVSYNLPLSCTPASPRHPGTVAPRRLSVNAYCMTGPP